ncbi:MAG: CARDB domain-containing protein [Candidatus Bipolaricaulota bacterium]
MKTNSIGISVTVFIFLAGLIFAGPTYAFGEPDLSITDISFSPSNPTPGEGVSINATVQNQGSSDADRFYVRLYVDGVRQEHKAISFGLDVGDSETVGFSWDAEAGEHEVEVIADDPFDKINESDEGNNSYVRYITVVPPATGGAAKDIRVAVTSFTDKSNSGFANVSNGVSDLVVQNLVNGGFQVLERQQIESVLLEQQFNPLNTSDLAQASRIAGADALIVGSVTGIDVDKSSIDLGFLSVTGATVRVDLSFRIISAYTSQILAADSVSATAEGQTDASFNFGTIVSSLTQTSQNVCTGGLKASKDLYYQGEVITIGYLDPSPPTALTVQFSGPSGPIGPSMFSNYRTSSPSNPCVTWSWNSPGPLTSGNYTANIYTVPPWTPLPVGPANFQVSSGSAPPSWVGQITFGTEQFQDSVVGDAVEEALSRMNSSLTTTLNSSASTLLGQREEFSISQTSEDTDGETPAADPGESSGLKCRVVSIEGDDNVILAGIDIECGAGVGLNEDDIFLIYPATQVNDPNTGAIIEIIASTDEPSGKVIVTGVYDKISRGEIIGNFSVQVGDLAILKE